MTWAFGKAILLGEHAVVYGQPALAGAIDATVRCTWRSVEAATRGGDEAPRGREVMLRVHAPAWKLEVEIARGAALPALDDASLGNPARAMAALVHALDAHLGLDVLGALGPGVITVDTRLPAAAGLGSSAALGVAVTRTLAHALGRHLSDDEVAMLAHNAERCFHSNPSGVDVALATRGGLGLFYRGVGLEPVHAPPMRLAVGLTGVPRSTAVMVERVAAAREVARAAGSTRVDDGLVALGRAALAGAEAMRAGDAAALGRLMNDAQEILAGLGVSSPEIDRLCEIARAAGALGVKLTGAGGGGAVIAIAGPGRGASHDASTGADSDAGPEGSEDAVLAAWRAAGHDGFVCRVGVTP
jgi:mevalonate kinase